MCLYNLSFKKQIGSWTILFYCIRINWICEIYKKRRKYWFLLTRAQRKEFIHSYKYAIFNINKYIYGQSITNISRALGIELTRNSLFSKSLN